jgi:SET domain-containing protein
MEIKYEIKETAECGKGLFALAEIPSGTRIWTYRLNENVLEYNERQLKAHLLQLSSLDEKQDFLDRTFGKGDVVCLITDDGQYMNHSADPNCATDLTTGHCYAQRPIQAGEQLFENYQTFSHPPFLYGLLKIYQCVPTYYKLPPLV